MCYKYILGFPSGSVVKEQNKTACRCRRCGFDSWSGRSLGERNGNPFQYSCLDNPIDRGAWWPAHGVTRVGQDLVTNNNKNRYILFCVYIYTCVCVCMNICNVYNICHIVNIDYGQEIEQWKEKLHFHMLCFNLNYYKNLVHLDFLKAIQNIINNIPNQRINIFECSEAYESIINK